MEKIILLEKHADAMYFKSNGEPILVSDMNSKHIENAIVFAQTKIEEYLKIIDILRTELDKRNEEFAKEMEEQAKCNEETAIPETVEEVAEVPVFELDPFDPFDD